MLTFGHVGITLATGLMIKRALSGRYVNTETGRNTATAVPSDELHLRKIFERMDLRVLAIGSMLPDIIDKPLGNFIFRSTFENGRIFAHTLLFLIAISAAGILLYKRKGSIWLITLAFGSVMHLIEDDIWNMPRTLLWPFMGITFDKYDYGNLLSLWWNEFLHVPSVYIPEWIGIAIVVAFASFLIWRREVKHFLKMGMLS